MLTTSVVEAKLLSITNPGKNNGVPLSSPLTITGLSAKPNATQTCSVQMKLNHGPFENTTPGTPNNFTTWSITTNETAVGPNHMEAQLQCFNPVVLKHLTRNFTGLADNLSITNNSTTSANKTAPPPPPAVNTTKPIAAPINNNTTPVIHASDPAPSKKHSSSHHFDGNSIVVMQHSQITGHHKVIHIHLH